MSRKTRQEKILAQLHRQKKIASVQPQPSQTQSIKYSIAQAPTFEKSATAEINSNLTTGLTNYHYLISDLRRIAIITGLAFLFEFFLYFFQGIG